MPASPVDVVYLHPQDNICVAARTLPPGTKIEVAGAKLELTEMVKIGHKISVRTIGAHEKVYKYGQVIGFTTQPVEPGRWVHSHNLIN
ncbi:MAG TPA: UxaA family hydrolase, partial [Pirellulaceae bacterium]|nr:UxaA family hydrolase [Pirellulaceae bacterium]